MANMLDNVAVRSMAKHRSKLMSLVESTKKRKKKKWAIPPSNIEHLVFKRIPTSPIDPGPHFNGTRLSFDDEDGNDQVDSQDELEPTKSELREISIDHALNRPDSVLDDDDSNTPQVPKMGLDSNYVLNGLTCSTAGVITAEEISPPDNFSDTAMTDEVPLSKTQSKTPIVLRIRNRSTSRSERQAKGKSTSELCVRSVHKTKSDPSYQKKRPTSQFYDSEVFEGQFEKDETPNQLSPKTACSPRSFASTDQLHITTSAPLTIPKQLANTSTAQFTPTDSLMQRFRKSFAIRFKKKSDEATPGKQDAAAKTPTNDILQMNSGIDSRPSIDKAAIQNRIPLTPLKAQMENGLSRTAQSNRVKNGPSIHSNSQRGRKKDWCRSLYYDSVDNVLNATINNESTDMPYLSGSDANILRKKAASTSDYPSQSKDAQRPVSIFDNSRKEKSEIDGKNVNYDKQAANIEHNQKKTPTQMWGANSVKLCRVHSHTATCPQRNRYRLRRSISQPVELEMSPSIQNLKELNHGSVDNDSFHKSFSSDDDVSSDSDLYHSYCCSPTSQSNAYWDESSGIMYAEALWDHETLDSEELPFQAGDVIEVTDTSDQDWWWGTKDGQEGWFPAAFVRLYINHRCPSLHDSESERLQNTFSPCKTNNLSSEQVRANIVQEIIATERDYVKHLKDVVEGYLKQVHRRPDMFSKERIETVFGNIKEIYNFQCQFLSQLENSLNADAYHLSQIGNCFLHHKEDFKMYSQYCNNHPLAVSELQELYFDSQYIHFFEACRLLQEMIDISLDGFLLTPIQRICKYPLQLAELLKYTDENHPDHIPVSNALAAMKEVAELVNERKRRMECLERIAEWQSTIEGWEGPDVLDTSSILLHCGEVTRVSSSWSRDIYLFIFDHLLIYCKKDLLKRHTYAYKGRLNLDHCDIVDTDDGRDTQFGFNVKNAWKIYCKDKDKWYLFYAKTALEKEQWLKAFMSERQRISEDEKQAFVVTEEAKKSARLAVHNKQKPKRPRAKFTKGRRCHPDVAVTELLLDTPSAKTRSGSLPSSIHPELAIMTGAKMGPTRKKGSGWFHFGSGKKPKS